jgi:SIR2-like domain
MQKQRLLTVILGAGFSKLAGLPVTNDINGFFLRDNSNNLLSFSSGEWRWDDIADSAHKNNGRLGFNHLAYGFLLNEWVKTYQEIMNGFSNYEDFYQFLLDNLQNKELIQSVYSKSYKDFELAHSTIKENQYYEYYTRPFRNPDYLEIFSLMNHLIKDFLFHQKTIEEIRSIYFNFIEYIRPMRNISFITLNHDTLLEDILIEILERTFSDGYSTDHGHLRCDGKPLRVFQNTFKETISVIKLHGSINNYQYSIVTEKGSFVQPSNEYLYFKTDNYDEKHHPERYDPDTGEMVQSFHGNITPQFITGTDKASTINRDFMYKSLYMRAKYELEVTNELMIIGYGFRDDHINQLIKEGIKKGKISCIVNINPAKVIPCICDTAAIINVPDISYLYSKALDS